MFARPEQSGATLPPQSVIPDIRQSVGQPLHAVAQRKPLIAEKPPMSFIVGAFFATGTALLACVALIILYFAFMLYGYFIVNPGASIAKSSLLKQGIIFSFVVILGISFLLGLPYKRGAWVLGLFIGLVFVGVIVPTLHNGYNGDFKAGYIAAGVIFIACPFVAEWGSRINRKLGWNIRDLQRPYLSLFSPYVLIPLIMVLLWGLSVIQHIK